MDGLLPDVNRLTGGAQGIPDKRNDNYELIYIKFSWMFNLIGIIYMLIFRANSQLKNVGVSVFVDVLLFSLFGILNYLKTLLIRRGAFNKNTIYMPLRAIELLMVIFCIIYFGIGDLACVAIIFPIIVTALCRGTRKSLILVVYSFVLHILVKGIKEILFENKGYSFFTEPIAHGFLLILFFYIVLAFFMAMCGRIYKRNITTQIENSRLVSELKEKYKQLESAQDKIKYHFEELKDTNAKLEASNEKLRGSIGEFYTLQQISKAISSIFDIKELFKFVNDIIIGVMGVSYSTIILYDESRKVLKVDTTSIGSKEELDAMDDNINCEVLLNALSEGKPLIENAVDSEKYIFTKGREVNSLISVPLNTKSRKFGLVLVEQKHANAFDEENVRLLDIIGQQVCFTMENARLYQELQQMASTDGLTGVYNRLYFQKRLETELRNAADEGYELTLAIFDIDHFKKFNDTYGHLFGDKVLKNIAELVKNSLRSTDIFARFGGEEFIIILPKTALKDGYIKVDELRQEVEKTRVDDGLISACVTVSFGVASYPACALTDNNLIRIADEALYEAKAGGRNCVKLGKRLDEGR